MSDAPDASDEHARFIDLARRGDGVGLATSFESLDGAALADVLGECSSTELREIFHALEPEASAVLLDRLPEVQAAELLKCLQGDDAAAILHELPSDERADLLGELAPKDAEEILAALPADEVQEYHRLAQYEDDVAGGLMITEYLAYPVQAEVGEVLGDLRRRAAEMDDLAVQYLYAISADGRLQGVLPLRQLLFTGAGHLVSDRMIRPVRSVADSASLEELRDFFARTSFLGVPVVDAIGRLVGVVRRDSVEHAASERSESEHLRSQGIVKEELRSMPLFVRARRRLTWLSANVVLNLCAAAVIAAHEETLQSAIALAVFLPIISDMSGCSGNQAVAVSMRELTLGLVRPGQVWRVWRKEIGVGLANGAALGVLVGGVAWVYRGNPWLGMVVGIAMMLNTIVAVSLGGCLPLVLKRFRIDPALASGPLLTTATDVCGFVLILTLASAFLDRIAGS